MGGADGSPLAGLPPGSQLLSRTPAEKHQGRDEGHPDLPCSLPHPSPPFSLDFPWPRAEEAGGEAA